MACSCGCRVISKMRYLEDGTRERIVSYCPNCGSVLSDDSESTIVHEQHTDTLDRIRRSQSGLLPKA